MNWPWSKTYNVKCPDGSTKTIYRDIDKAFPLSIKDEESSIEAQMAIQKEATAKLKKDYQEKINGLLFTISKQNQSLMMSYRNVYLTFKSDPCGNSDILRRQTEEFNQGQQRLAEAEMQIAGLIQLAGKPNNSDQILNSYEKIIQKFNIDAPVSLTVRAIKENIANAEKWIKGGEDE